MLISRRSFLTALLGAFGVPVEVFCATIKIKGISYMSMADLARLCGMQYTRLSSTKTQSVFSKTSKMTFEINSRMFTLNGLKVWLAYPIAARGGLLYIAKNDFAKTIRPILFPQQMGKPPSAFHIIVDAGHGGKDNGAMNKRLRLKEKVITLDVASRLGKILRQNGYRVTFTRTRDTFVELSDRAEIANRARANLFVSIHCNSASPSVDGVETFAMTPRYMPSTSSKTFSYSDKTSHAGNTYDGWDQLLSYYIQREMVSATKAEDRGVKRARFAVLKSTAMPSSLVEIGFLSNTAEARKLAMPAYRQRIAAALARAIFRYHSTIRRLTKARAK